LSRITSRRNVPSTRVASTAPVPAGRRARRSRGSPASQGPQQLPAVGVRVGAHPARAVRRQRRHECDRAALGVEQLLRAVRPHPLLEQLQVPGVRRVSAKGTWCERQLPSVGLPSTSCGPVQPFGERSTIIGQRGRAGASRGRAAGSGDVVRQRSGARRSAWCMVGVVARRRRAVPVARSRSSQLVLGMRPAPSGWRSCSR
jgi:hypothetical protein